MITFCGNRAGVGMGVGRLIPMSAGGGVGVAVAMENKVAITAGVTPAQLAMTMKAISRTVVHFLFTTGAITP